ncbi:death-on-curing protein [Candidatus Gottesmanbacteria bacterium]|nr:death-on-curing protein [Candidatus Gottesmanbacteria bacterium]
MKDILVQNQIIIYQADDSTPKLDVHIDGDTVWLTQGQMATLFERDQSVVSRHIKNVFEEGELDQKSNMQNMGNQKELVNYVK